MGLINASGQAYLIHGINCGCSGCMLRLEERAAAQGKYLEAEVDTHGEWRVINPPPEAVDTN